LNNQEIFKMAKGTTTHGGKREGAGRKRRVEEQQLNSLLDRCWTLADREACIRSLATQANDSTSENHMDAVKLLMAYAYGKPTEYKDITSGGERLQPHTFNILPGAVIDDDSDAK